MYEALRRFMPEDRLFTNEQLSKHTSFKIGGVAEVYALPKNADELKHIAETCHERGVKLTLLGGGTNVLVSDKGIKGVVVQLYPQMNRIQVLDNGRIRADAGITLRELAETACRAGLEGLAFASGIPGTVGGAVYMNAGAYDCDISGVLLSAEVLEAGGKTVTLQNEAMGFGYRRSIVQESGAYILEAEFQLAQGDPASIRAQMRELNLKRAKSQPLDFPSAGSVFKRPPGYFAGKLIADAGLKGYQIGGAQVSEKHAGFIINKQGATAKDVLKLIGHIRQTVHAEFGVWLEPEVRLLGDMD